MTRPRLLSILLITFLVGCYDQELPHNFAIVKTHEVTNITSEGVQFNGEILTLGKPEEILDYGFTWSQSANSKDLTNSVALENPAMPGKIFYTLSQGLLIGKTYYVRTFIRTRNHTVYGNEVSFLSNGSKGPIIVGFEPKVGIDGDEIIITGEYFSNNKSINEVSIGGLVAEIKEATSTKLKVIIPTSSYVGKAQITVTVDTRKTNSTDSLTILGPQITSVTPTEMYVGEKIEINGQNLYFNHLNTNAVITKDTLETRYGSSIHFVESSPSKLDGWVLPASFFGKQTIDYKLQIAVGDKLSNNVSIRLKNAWSKLSVQNPLGEYIRVNSVAVNGKGYFLGGMHTENYSLSNSVWKFDPLTNTWTKMADFPGNPRHSAFVASFGDFIYYGMGFGNSFSGGFQDIWMYDTNLDSWIYVTDFPSEISNLSSPVSFSLGEKIYLGFGGHYSDFWSYNINTGQWAEAPKPIGSTGQLIGFSANGKGYLIVLSASLAKFSYIWEFDPTLNTWAPKLEMLPDFYVRNVANIISNGDDVYFIYYGLYYDLFIAKFSLTNKFCISLQNLEAPVREFAPTFIINKKLYLGGIAELPPHRLFDFWMLELQ